MSENKLLKIEPLFSKILKVILFLFLVELVLGESGNTIVIGGMYIRKILFALSLISMCLYIAVFARKITIKRFDWVVFAFLIINVIWMTIIPYIKGTSVSNAINDADTLFILLLYFPIVFLVRQNKLDWEKVKKLFIFLTVLLAVWHIALYLLESFWPGLYIGYYKSFLPAVTFGLFGGATPIFGYGYVRIITTTSIYLIVAFFYLVGFGEKKIRHYIYLFLLMMAIMTTMTRSLLISAIAGLLIFLIPIGRGMLGKSFWKRLALVAGLLVAFVALNYAFISPASGVYKDRVVAKYESGEKLSESELAVIQGISKGQNDAIGRIGSSASSTDVGNLLRSEQTKALVRKWEASPVVGFGYGSYAKDMIRNENIPICMNRQCPPCS